MEDSGYGSLVVDNCSGTNSTATSPNQSFFSSESSRKRKCDSGIECSTPSWTGNFNDANTSLFISPAKRALTDSMASLCTIQSEPNSPQTTTVKNVATSISLRKVISFDCTSSYTPTFVELPKRSQSVLGRKRTWAVTKSKDHRQSAIAKSIRLQTRRLDFMKIFTIETSNLAIISKIFSYLSDDDLRAVSSVSLHWRRILFSDKLAYERYLLAENRYNASKENLIFEFLAKIERSSTTTKELSPPRSPKSEKHNQFIKIAAKLEDMQTLTKCFQCDNPAIIDDNIAECTKCVRIWCTLCLRNVSIETKNRPSSPRIELKEISPNKAHRLIPPDSFFSHNDDSCSSSSSSNSDDHLIRKYFITSNGKDPDPDPNQRSNSVDYARKFIPKLPIKRALNFSKYSSNSFSADLSKNDILSDFTNTITNNQSSAILSRTSNNTKTILSPTKRKTVSRLHICENDINSHSPDELNITNSPKDRKTTKRRLRRLCR